MAPLAFAANRDGETVLALWIAAAGILATGLAGCLAGLFTPWLLGLAALTGAATVVGALWYPPRYAASLRGRFDGVAVRAEKGVLWKREIYVPASALRTVESGSTPLQRKLHCRTVVLRFAGGAVLLPLVPEKEAEDLSRALEAVSAGEEPAPPPPSGPA
ncbi:MAG TPA: PH domain-containing protein [Firmicutes bacterium]|nr:PH domain-containing protein [Bacillota bacterium]